MAYRHIVGTFKCVCKMARVGQIFGPFLAPNRAEICQYVFLVYFGQISTGFTWNIIH